MNPQTVFEEGLKLYHGRNDDEGKFEPTDRAAGVTKIKEAADKGYVDAQLEYAEMLYYGRGVVAKDEEAAKYYRMAADQGNADATYRLGGILEHGSTLGKVIKPDTENAKKYYKIAAEKGHILANERYNNMLKSGYSNSKAFSGKFGDGGGASATEVVKRMNTRSHNSKSRRHRRRRTNKKSRKSHKVRKSHRRKYRKHRAVRR
jgi:TPR repeat protein